MSVQLQKALINSILAPTLPSSVSTPLSALLCSYPKKPMTLSFPFSNPIHLQSTFRPLSDNSPFSVPQYSPLECPPTQHSRPYQHFTTRLFGETHPPHPAPSSLLVLFFFTQFFLSFLSARCYRRLFQFSIYTLSFIPPTAERGFRSHFLPPPCSYPSSSFSHI